MEKFNNEAVMGLIKQNNFYLLEQYFVDNNVDGSMLKDMEENDPIPETPTVPALQYKLQYRKLLKCIAFVIEGEEVQTSKSVIVDADTISSFQTVLSASNLPSFEPNVQLTRDLPSIHQDIQQNGLTESLFSDNTSSNSSSMPSEASNSNSNESNLYFGSQASPNKTFSSQELASTEERLGLHNKWPRKFEFPLEAFKPKFIKKLSDPDKSLSKRDENKVVKKLFEKASKYQM